ncbi:MAG: hypothetical protein AAF182_00325 [Pseudomonadota bacterium]
MLLPERDYLPRMEKIEALFEDLKRSTEKGGDFRKRTLGGLIFEVDEKNHTLMVYKEK